ncbi:hypothetical protein B0T26DRAFT_713984, partial [Lasiosphaeria miniovina]
LPEDSNVFDQLTIHEVNDTTGVPADFGPADESVEEPEPEDGDVVDEAAVPNFLIQETELNQLRGHVEKTVTEDAE